MSSGPGMNIDLSSEILWETRPFEIAPCRGNLYALRPIGTTAYRPLIAWRNGLRAPRIRLATIVFKISEFFAKYVD